LFLSASTFNPGTQVATAAENTPVVEASTAKLTAAPVDETTATPEKPIVSVEQYVKQYYAKTPILAKVAFCESRYKMFNADGSVMRGREVHEDVGVMQINETYHAATAKKLGYNIYTLDGNLAYGKYLYETQGVQPWSASAPCWNR
jgi:hypothetical protein